MSEENFIQRRLDALSEIDERVVDILKNISDLFDTYMEPTDHAQADLYHTKEDFEQKVKQVYSTLSSLAIGLRKEVKIVDDNTGVFDKNEAGVMILPISVDKKNTELGARKLEDELKKLTKS